MARPKKADLMRTGRKGVGRVRKFKPAHADCPANRMLAKHPKFKHLKH